MVAIAKQSTQQTTTKRLRPFFSFYGAKWRAAPHYPAPRFDTVIEAFAGSACYATLHYEKNVVLYDIDPVIAGLWDYLIRVSEYEILSLPLKFGHIDDLSVCSEAKSLIGFWLNKGSSQPRKQPSKWMRSGSAGFWGETIRSRVANQLKYIRHWKILNKSYTEIPKTEATYFIDPPYSQEHGRHYKYSEVNFSHLAEWCGERPGQVIVCEAHGADWLPFEDFRTVRATNGSRGKGKSREMMWLNDQPTLAV